MKSKLLAVAILFVVSLKVFSQGAPACPSITPVATPNTICQGQCSNLTSTVVTNYQTTSYSVSSIPYAPYAYSGGTGVSVNTDDVWSPVVNLGFTFCYFGNAYTQCVIGSNGHVTFDLSYANGYDSYPVNAALPSTANMPGNTICAAFRDIDPSVSGGCKYYTTGTAPCRALVIYWNNIALYSCGTPHSTFQMVLYENTNYIDVYIQNSSGSCSTWQGGRGIVGIQNAAATVAVCPPGRNNSAWTATNEAWRFTPSGPASYNITWTGPSGVVGTGLGPVSVCPTTNTTYTSSMSLTDCNGSVTTYTNTVGVTVTPGPTVTVNSGTICPGANTALTASGATTYNWSPGTGLSATTGANVTANPSSTTTYTVSGTTGGCVGTATALVTVNPTPTVSVNSVTMCAGNTATLTASGANTYTWSPSGTLDASTGSTVHATPGSSTVYTITATSAAGCTTTATSSVTIGGSITPSATSGTMCAGGSTTLSASGATTYTWSPGTGLSSTTGATVTANPAATTSYTITASSGGCTGTTTAAVTVNPLPTITVNNGTICNGGSVTLTASGANSYAWSPGTGLSSTTGSSVSANPPSTTTYTITGTTAAGCVGTQTATVTVVTNPTVTVPPATICSGSSTTLTASGASTYVWSPATGLSGTSGTSVTANPTSTTVYTITGSAGTCTAVGTTTVTVNPLPVITVNSGTICVGQQTATLNAGGASTYSWTPSTSLSSSTGSSVVANPSVTTIYTVTGTDANTCVNTNTTSVLVNPLPTITANNGFVCNGSSVALTANGATTYAWSPGTGLSATTGSTVTAAPASTTQYTITGTDGNGCVNSDTTTVTVVANPTVTVPSATICTGSSTTLTASGASTYVWSPGTGLSSTSGTSVVANPAATMVYTITGTAGTCTAVTTTTVNVNPLPVVVASSNAPRCVNQNLSFTASPAVTYSWSGPNGFNSISPNPGISSVTMSDAGIYTLTVSDANGCVNSDTAKVIINPLPIVTATGATVCIGSTINLSSTPNNAASYSWNNASTGYSSNLQNPSIPNATASMSGSYVVTVTDVNGCASGNVANVVVNPSLVIAAGSNSPVCENGTLNLTSNNGVSWSWSGPGGFTSFAQNPSISFVQLTAAGTYTVVGTDANGCQGTDVVTVVINALPTITANSATICATQQTAVLNANGANTYTWSPAASLNSSTGGSVNATPMVTTSYTIVGTDNNGCINVGTTSVLVNQLPTVTATSGVICLNNFATLTASGASTYSWSPSTGLSSATGNTVSAGPSSTTSYTITGTDANGCYNTGVTSVTVNPLPSVSVNSGSICFGKTLTLNATGANTYAWTPVSGLNSSTGASVSASPSSTSSYSVIGTDVNGCRDTAVAVVTVNTLPILNVGPALSSNCSPVCVSLSNSSGATGTCSWNMGDGTTSTSCSPQHCYTGQGTFNAILTLTDANGCVGTDTAVIIVFPIPDADFNYGPQPTTIFDPNITFTDATSSAVISTWSWSFGDPLNSTASTQNTSFNYANAGTYPVTLTVKSDHGCVDTVTKIVVIAEDYMVYVPNAFSPNFDGTNDYFGAKGEGIKDFKLYIFDRWGNQVYYSEDIDKWWDGRYQSKGDNVMAQDVYVWKIELKNFKGEPHMLKGTVTLLR